MRDFQGRRRVRRFIYSKVTIVALLLLVLFMSKAVWGVYAKNHLAGAGKKQAEGSLTELEGQKSELQKKVVWLRTDRGQEEEIRKNYSVLKPGEKVITIVEGESTSSVKINNKSNGGWWTAGWQALADIFS